MCKRSKPVSEHFTSPTSPPDQASPEQPELDGALTTVAVDPETLPPPPAPRRKARRLYTWLGFSSGFSVLLVTLLTGFTVFLVFRQIQLERQLAVLSAEKAAVDRLQDVEQQVNQLNQQVSLLNQRVPKGLPNQLKQIQADLKANQSQINDLESTAATREQVQQAIRQEIQQRIRNQSLPTPTNN